MLISYGIYEKSMLAHAFENTVYWRLGKVGEWDFNSEQCCSRATLYKYINAVCISEDGETREFSPCPILAFRQI